MSPEHQGRALSQAPQACATPNEWSAPEAEAEAAVGKPPLLVLDELRFFNPYAEIKHTANRLPHWQQSGAVYFVTFRLADAVPTALREEWESERAAWLRWHPQPWTAETEAEYHARFSTAVERWLDAGHGGCVLRDGRCAEIVSAALRHFDGDRCAQIAFVIMPNHVHALFVQREGWALEQLLHSWKLFSARRIQCGARSARSVVAARLLRSARAG